MKPEFSRPFNLEHARAGAPFGCRDGRVATILKWDGRRPGEPLIGYQGEDDIPASWAVDGAYSREHESHLDLLSLPLGMLDGKPVFTGDAIEDDGPAGWVLGVAYVHNRNFTNCRWPALVKAYPETLMADAQLECAAGTGMWVHSSKLRDIANAALRHAVDAGQLIEPGDRAARDMAVAVAVRNMAQSARPVARGYDLSEDASELAARIAQLDLAVIIAAIK